MDAERARLLEARERAVPWRRWGPYLSERQWGTVREDYSSDGSAWDHFTHDQARSRAYRWGEDGLAGYSDDKQRLCFALALWNGRDPILKERLFGLTNAEGNHGEDVKEYYFYVDATPTHSWLKWLYKYPHAAFPYADLVATNRARGRHEREYELLDTGVFAEDRYFDVAVEFGKANPEDTLIRVTATNRGPETATLHLLPTLWFRNTWSGNPDARKPILRALDGPGAGRTIAAAHPDLGERWLYVEERARLLFTENETNAERIFGAASATPYVKDAFHELIVGGRPEAVNPARTGTKAAALHVLEIPPGESRSVRLRLTNAAPGTGPAAGPFGASFDLAMAMREGEADSFYASLAPDTIGEDAANVFRQALAGMIWSKQYYLFDVDRWLGEHGADPTRGGARAVRNRDWFHMLNDDVISMPDKWEYPWYAAWDLAFHTVALGVVDPDFAKRQLELMLTELYLHPSGQIPAYEWNFGDVNPPVHAWATLFLYLGEKERTGAGDLEFLETSFRKLLVNFTWWVNRKDPAGRNVFEGGFLGLDNIGVFDRSAPLPTGGRLEQADGTAWMAFYSLNMLEIALEIAEHDPAHEDMVVKFFEHFLWIASAMDRAGDRHDAMWDEADGFFYDLLRLPDGSAERLKVRSLVGLLPLCAVTVVEKSAARFPRLAERARQFLDRHPAVVANIAPIARAGVRGRRLLSVLNEEKLRRVLSRMLDENEFLGPHGVRSLSKFHEKNPYALSVHGETYRVGYLPAESDSGTFGGNSNWRGPVWFPMNALIVRALLQYYAFYGDEFRIECPTGSGHEMTLFDVSRELAVRLARTFLRGADGRRPVYGGSETFQTNPHWKDLILFYEYFHGDNGAGLGASHQTGWTGLVAPLIGLFGRLDPRTLLEEDKAAALRDVPATD